MVVLEVTDVRKEFRLPKGRVVSALAGANVRIVRGEFVALLGKNGSGKSTLLDVVSGYVRQDSGRVVFCGSEISAEPPYRRAKYISRIYQSRDAYLPGSLRVEEVLRLALESAGGRGRPWRLAVRELLDALRPDLARVASEQVWHLSGGEHQLVSLAVAQLLSSRVGIGEAGCHLLLLDEHTSQLDPVAREVVIAATASMVERLGVAAVMATHDCELGARFGGRQIILADGRVAHDLSGAQVLRSAAGLEELVRRSGAASEVEP